MTLPPSSACIATRNPPPEVLPFSTPIKESRDRTRTLSKLTLVVGCAFQPILFSGAPKDRPLVPFSTRNAVMEEVFLLLEEEEGAEEGEEEEEEEESFSTFAMTK